MIKKKEESRNLFRSLNIAESITFRIFCIFLRIECTVRIFNFSELYWQTHKYPQPIYRVKYIKHETYKASIVQRNYVKRIFEETLLK